MTRTKAVQHQDSEVKFVAGGPFEFFVNWRKPIEILLIEAYFDNGLDPLLRAKLDIAPSDVRSGEVEAEIVVVERRSSTEDLLHMFDRLDLRPGTLRELVQLAIAEPNLQRKLPIVALGSIFNARKKDYLAYLDGNVDERTLNLGWAGNGWRTRYGYLVFPKMP